jgi:Protein of unknown function (DUF2637)
MTRAGTGSQASPGAVSAPASRADTCIRAAAGVTVAGLAGIAGAISYSHMQELAAAHGETGWQAHAFPLSVDGIEVVASLVLLADRRLGRRPGWLPWAALAAGTTASLAANVAAAGAGPVGRVIAGWPAFALLVAVKLLSGMLEHRHGADRLAGTRDRPVPVQDRPPAADAGGDDHGMAGSRVRDPRMTGAGGDGGTGRLAGAGTVPHLVTSNGLALDPGTGTGTGTRRPPGRGRNQGTGRGRSRQPWQGRLPRPGRERILRPAPCCLPPAPPGTACSAGAIR